MKNEQRGLEGVSCLSKVSVTLSETTITLLKGRHTLVRPSSTQPPGAAAGGGLICPAPLERSMWSGRGHECAVGLWESAAGSP